MRGTPHLSLWRQTVIPTPVPICRPARPRVLVLRAPDREPSGATPLGGFGARRARRSSALQGVEFAAPPLACLRANQRSSGRYAIETPGRHRQLLPDQGPQFLVRFTDVNALGAKGVQKGLGTPP